MCRQDLEKEAWDLDQLLSQQDGVLQPEKGDVLIRTKSLEDLQKKMNDLFQCQQRRGALITNTN